MANQITFKELKKYALSYWGLTLSKNDPNSRGRWNGCWKTGYSLSGQFPGEGHSWRRYSTLKQITQQLGYKND